MYRYMQGYLWEIPTDCEMLAERCLQGANLTLEGVDP